MTTTCPSCGYQRQASDTAAYPGTCPACGIAYAKWRQPGTEHAPADAEQKAATEAEEQRRAEAAEQALLALKPLGGVQAPEAFPVPVDTFWGRARHYTCFMPSDGHIAAFWAHLALYLILFIWGLQFLWHGLDALWISRSFLHSANLPFHEFGHVLFGPYGTYAMYLGGSLFQVLVPLLLLAWFMVWQRDNFAAAMMLWWCGQSFIDVAPYIADAQLRVLPLINGAEENHDWWNLLSMSGALEWADYYANLCFSIGAAVMVLSFVWGAYLLSIEFRGRTLPPSRTPEASA